MPFIDEGALERTASGSGTRASLAAFVDARQIGGELGLLGNAPEGYLRGTATHATVLDPRHLPNQMSSCAWHFMMPTVHPDVCSMPDHAATSFQRGPPSALALAEGGEAISQRIVSVPVCAACA